MNNLRSLILDTQNDSLEYIYEQENKDKPVSHYLHGPFMMAEQPNKNHRVYNIDEMVKEVERYNKDYVTANRALGELNHPSNSASVDLERAAHMVVKLEQKGNLFYGKTKILSTPTGTVVKQLLSDGVRVGISTRALGKLVKQGQNDLVEDFYLICLDLVHEPSAPAMLESILENKQYLIAEGGKIVEVAIGNLRRRVDSVPKGELNYYLEECFKKFFSDLKKR